MADPLPASAEIQPAPRFLREAKTVSMFLMLVCAIGKASTAHPEGSSGKGVSVQRAVHRRVGADTAEAHGVSILLGDLAVVA